MALLAVSALAQVSPETFSGLRWRLIGPFRGGRVVAVSGVAGDSTTFYFGGVNGLLAETQVVNRWYLMPLQLFCFGFGMTHSIHHIVVGQPFYLRHLIRKECYPAMQKYGVNFNDMGTFRRRNHYPNNTPDPVPAGGPALVGA